VSDILTRKSAAQHIEWLTHEASNHEWADLPGTIESLTSEINATLDALDTAVKRDAMWKGIVNDFLVTMIDLALDDDADSRERRRKQAYSRMEIMLGQTPPLTIDL
jgi:hypothetical protein